MKSLIACLTTLLRRLEHIAAGDVDAILAPLRKMHAKLHTASARSSALASKARAEADEIRNHAATLSMKAMDAATAANKFGALIGR